MVDGVAPLDLNQTPPLDTPCPSAAAAEMVDGIASADSNQIPPLDPPSPSDAAAEMVDGVAPVDLNQIRPPDHPSSSSSAAPHQPLINYSRPTSHHHCSREEHALFLLGVELYGHGNSKVLQRFRELLRDLAETGESPVLIPPNSENKQNLAEERLFNTALLWIAKLFPDATAEMVYKRYQDLRGVSPVDSDHHWSREEHALFLLGVELYGQGKSSDISKYAVRTKERAQVASHSQKYNIHQQKKKTAKRGTRRESIHDLTLSEFGLDNLQHLISSRPHLKDRLKDKGCPFPFHPVLMNELRERIHDTPPPIPQPPESEGAEKKGTEDKGESSSGRDQQEN